MFNVFFELFADFGNIAGIVTLVATILGAVSLFIVNMGRFYQARKFGIPLRYVHQVNISESIELWIALMGTLGFGILVPIFILIADWQWWGVLPVVFASYFMACVMTKSGTAFHQGKKVERDGKQYSVSYDVTIFMYANRSIYASLTYLRIRNLYTAFILEEAIGGGLFNQLVSILAVILLLYFYFRLLGQLKSNTIDRLLGNQESISTEIDGKKYFVAMRHNQYQWFLMEYYLETGWKRFRIGTAKYRLYQSNTYYSIAKFTKSNFIIKDLTELEGQLKQLSVDKFVDKNWRGYFKFEYEVSDDDYNFIHEAYKDDSAANGKRDS